MPPIQKLARVLPLALVPLYACADQGPTAVSAPAGTVAYTAPAEPVDGEFVRQTGTNTVFLSYGRVLYGVQDGQTLRACTGGREKVVREVGALPGWERRTLPSAGNPQTRPHGRAWMHGDRPVQVSGDPTVWIVVGCVKSPIASGTTYQALFGDQDWSRILIVPSADLAALPTGPQASNVPLRRAGSLMESGGTVTWVTSHGSSLGIESGAIMDSYCRPWSDLVSSAAEYTVYGIKGLLQPGPSSGCLRGNDYPYAASSTSGVDAWNYYNRQCTSFSAWRLNQDGIEFHNQYRGQHFSHAHTWDDAARAAGLAVNSTPKQGAVAQWNAASWNGNYGHVAYVAAVHNDGYVTVEEYNYTAYAYGTRRIPASSIHNFIHFR
jgi:surface antigen